MKSMKFFEGIKTLDELRKEYRRLAFLYHPDKGGDTAIMQVINDQYDRLSKKLINSNETFSEGRKEYEQQVSEDMRQRLDRIIGLPGIVIELIGSWIWITGNTFPLRDTLKGEGYKFSHPKTAWYWHKGEYFKKSGKLMSMDDMRDACSSEKVESKAKANYVNLNLKLCFQEIVSDQTVIVQCVHRTTTILMIVIRIKILVVPVMVRIRILMLILCCKGKWLRHFF